MDLRERGAGNARHPWEIARASFFLDVLRDHVVPVAAGCAVLDVGAGDGYFATELRRELLSSADVTLWDSGYRADDVAALERQGFRATTSEPVIASASERFDLVLLLDVLEHVDDPRATLDSAVACAADDACVLVSVPALPALWSSHDDALAHRRRFRAREAKALIEDTGLHIVECGGVFHSLVAARAAGVVVEKVLRPRAVNGEHGVGGWRLGATLASIVARGLEAEHVLARALSRRHIDVPGLSWWALAKR